MPPVSQKQRSAMAMAAKGKGNLGIPASVGKDFIAADTGKKLPKFAKAKGKKKQKGPPRAFR